MRAQTPSVDFPFLLCGLCIARVSKANGEDDDGAGSMVVGTRRHRSDSPKKYGGNSVA